MALRPLKERLQEDSILILDGATGTELQRRGFELNSPGWSASAIRENPELLYEIHREYVEAGAEIVTANTFRTHARNLRETAWSGEELSLTIEAVQIARQAAGERAYVAGSIAPLEDCYSPELTPNDEFLKTEHRNMVLHLMSAGVDLILIETQLTIREAVIAAGLCCSLGVPYMLSFTCGRDGRLLSGESLKLAATEVLRFAPLAILVNCLPVEEVLDRLAEVRPLHSEIPLGAYANTGRLTADGTWELTQGENPAVYAGFAKSWEQFGIKIIGGCCGTSPLHVSHLVERFCDQ